MPCNELLARLLVITVYPKKYAHGFVVLCFVVVMQSFIMNSHEVFIHIHQGCFAGTGAIVRLPQCQWSKPDGYGKISQCKTTTKHSKAKTVCIFLGIYCSYMILENVWLFADIFTCLLFKKEKWYSDTNFTEVCSLGSNWHFIFIHKHWCRWKIISNPAKTKCNKHIIITSKQCFDVKIMYLLHCVFAGKVVWHSSEGNFKEDLKILISKTRFKIAGKIHVILYKISASIWRLNPFHDVDIWLVDIYSWVFIHLQVSIAFYLVLITDKATSYILNPIHG